MKRFVPLFLALVLLTLIPLASLAEANVALNPDDSWWGMSRTKFKETFGDVSFEEVTVDRHKALALRAVDIGSLTVDVYFDFAQREAGKSYYTLSKVAYIVPLETRKFSSNALSRTYNTLVDIVTAENGRPAQSGSKSATWSFIDYSITVSRGAFKAYNGSNWDTAAVVYELNAEAAASPTAAPKTSTASSGRGGKSASLTVTPSAVCKDENHIGSNWTQEFSVNGRKVSEGSKVTLAVGDTLTVKAVITDNDSNPDVGENTATRTVTQNDLDRGFKMTMKVSVTENGGRYKGETADWTVTFAFAK